MEILSDFPKIQCPFIRQTFLIEGIFRSTGKGYLLADGEQAGECIGPKAQGNPYKLDFHEWYPFEKTIASKKGRAEIEEQ